MVHGPFTLAVMSGKDEVTLRALEIAQNKYGWTRAKFSEEAGVSTQVVTNWLARGMAPHAYERVAKRLHISVDELLGKKPLADASRVSEATVAVYNVDLPESAILFAAEFAKLPAPLQAQVQALVHTLVSELGRDQRDKRPSSGAKVSLTSSRPARSHG